MKQIIAGIPIRHYYDGKKKILGIYERYLKYLEKYHFCIFFLTDNNIKQFINHLDCLILIGGGDLNPLLYNKQDNFINYDYDLDSLEYQAIDLALKKKMPILGICRGLQILNVYFHGSLKEVPPTHIGMHLVKNNEVSYFTNSFHHQCIDVLADNFVALAYSSDGIIEEIEDKKRMIFAVQYHPEINFDYTILSRFCRYFK